MDPVTLIVTALAAGTASALQDDTKGVVKVALLRLRALVKKRLAGRSSGEFMLTQHEQAPDVYEKPLEHELKEVGAATDSELVNAAQELMELLDAQGTAAGKYVIRIQSSTGVQVGDHNMQVNSFGGVTVGP
jgi:flagellar basal body rod protein FlgF